MFEYRLEHILSFTARLGGREIIGPVPEGLRVNAQVTGGEVTGPKVAGKLRALSGDWVTVRRDGIAILDVRTTIETNDGAPIYVTYSGTSDRGEDGSRPSPTRSTPGDACRCPAPTLVGGTEGADRAGDLRTRNVGCESVTREFVQFHSAPGVLGFSPPAISNALMRTSEC